MDNGSGDNTPDSVATVSAKASFAHRLEGERTNEHTDNAFGFAAAACRLLRWLATLCLIYDTLHKHSYKHTHSMHTHIHFQICQVSSDENLATNRVSTVAVIHWWMRVKLVAKS